MTVEAHKSGLFYGWWIVIGASVAFAMNGGLYFYGFGAFFDSLLREFGSSRAALSGVVSLSRLEHGLMGPVEGFLVDRFGPRIVVILTSIAVGIAMILLSSFSNLWQLYLLFGLGVGIGLSGLGLVSNTALVVRWFSKRRTIALSILQSSFPLGRLILVPFIKKI